MAAIAALTGGKARDGVGALVVASGRTPAFFATSKKRAAFGCAADSDYGAVGQSACQVTRAGPRPSSSQALYVVAVRAIRPAQAAKISVRLALISADDAVQSVTVDPGIVADLL